MVYTIVLLVGAIAVWVAGLFGKVSTLCVGTDLKRKQGEFGDPAPDLLRALQSSIDKIRPESY